MIEQSTDNSNRIKLIASAAAVLVALAFFWALRAGSGDNWQPYSFAANAHKEATVCLMPWSPKAHRTSCSKSDRKLLSKWEGEEIDSDDYSTLSKMADHDLTLRPFIKEAMEDGKVTNSEWNVIIDVNDQSWDHYRAVQHQEAKQNLKKAL